MSQKEIVGLDCGELLLSVKYGIVFDKSNFVLSSESAISGRDVNTIVNNRFEYNVKWDDGKSPDSIVTMSAPNFVVGNNLALISADVKLKNGETKQFDEFALVNTSTKCEFFVNSIDQPQRGNVILIDSEKKQFNSLRDFVVSPESSRGDGFEAISLLVGAVLGVVLGLLDVFHKGKGEGRGEAKELQPPSVRDARGVGALQRGVKVRRVPEPTLVLV